MLRLKPITLAVTVTVPIGMFVFLGQALLVSTTTNETASQSTAAVLTSTEYDAVISKFLALVEKKGPQSALSLMRARVQNDAALARVCHDVVHEIGRAALEGSRDFAGAARYHDPVCNSGYLHGVIEAYFSKSADVFSALGDVCGDYRVESYLGWECYHGVGHGLMYYTANDLPRSLALCEALSDTSTRSVCENGVFMENFSADELLHPSRFVSAADPLYPCREQRKDLKAICYMYAPIYYLRLHENDYSGALRLCAESAERAHRSSCARGVGSQVMKENVTHPLLIETICASGKNDQRRPCMTGAIGLFINHHGALAEARSLCPQLARENRAVCYSVIEASASLFAVP